MDEVVPLSLPKGLTEEALKPRLLMLDSTLRYDRRADHLTAIFFIKGMISSWSKSEKVLIQVGL